MSDEIVFDNFIITDDKQLHETWVEQTWVKKSTAEAQSTGGVSTLYREYIDLRKRRIEKPVKFESSSFGLCSLMFFVYTLATDLEKKQQVFEKLYLHLY